MADNGCKTARIALGVVGCVLLVVGLVFGPNDGLPRYMLPICLVLGLVLVLCAVLTPMRWVRRLREFVRGLGR